VQSLLPKSRFFPPAELAEPEGVVLFGGRLSPEWLLDAYAHGIFPWPIFDGADVVVWWSPDPRAIFELDRFRVPRRLKRTCDGGRFEVTCDRDFAGVIRGCATAGDRRHNTWLTPKMIDAYIRLHALGHAHSVEVWHDGALAGGVYGVALGGLFAGESMFHHVRDASKVALVRLVAHLRARGYRLFDIQQRTPHTSGFGAVEIPRAQYLRRLAAALAQDVTFGDRLEGWPREATRERGSNEESPGGAGG
jgi:leucyl/phenylalanyl-tRNA--protein transferase